MGDRKRSDSGQFIETVTLEGVLDVFNRVRGPVITSSDVSQEFGCTTEAARQKLTRLYDQGRVDKRKTGRTVVYWRTDSDLDQVELEEAIDRRHTDESFDEIEANPEPEPPVSTPIDQLVDDVADDVLPGSGSKLEQRRDALQATIEYLREHGTATPSDIKNEVYPEHTAGYTSGKDPARSWWKNCIYKGLAAIAERSDAIEKADHTGEWTYTGGDA